jgi:integrase
VEDIEIGRRRMLGLVVQRRGYVVAEITAESDPEDASDLQRLLIDAVRRDGKDLSELPDFTMEVSDAATHVRMRTFVVSSR